MEFSIPFIAIPTGLVAGLSADALIRHVPWAVERRLHADVEDYLGTFGHTSVQTPVLAPAPPITLRASLGTARLWWVIVMCIALIGASLAVFGINFKGAAAAGLCVLLVALAMIDLEHQLLPDVLTLPLLWAGLLVNVQGTFAPLASAVLGAAAGYGVLWVLYWAFRLLARKEGMGFGDFKLLAALGAWLGTGHLLEMILVSSVVAAVTTLALIALKKMDRENLFPFGPFLAIAGVVSLLVGPLALPVV